MEHEIEWYQGLMDELDTEFQPLVDMFDYIDDMVLPSWSLPPEFTAVVKDVMAVIDTAPSDAVKSAAIAFSRNIPIFSVMPFRANPDEYDRAQRLEDNLRYQFKRSNKRGNGSVMYDMAESSLRYDTICVRKDDLVHILPRNKSSWTALQKQAWSHGRFIETVYSPKNVRYMYSHLGKTFVGCAETMRVMDAIAYWELYKGNDTDEGRMVAGALDDIQAAISDVKDSFKLNDLYITQTYTIDYDKVCVWGSLTNSNGDEVVRSGTVGDKYEFKFADQKNPYGFINWSVRVAGSRLDGRVEYRVSPMLAPLYWGKSWDKINLFKSVVFSEPFRRARSPRGISITNSGEAVQVDYAEGADVNVRLGEDYKPFVPITLDQGAVAVIAALEAAMNRTTGASMIGDTTKIDSRTPFATFAAMVKVAMSRLDRQNALLADTVTDLAEIGLQWVDKTDVPLTAYVEHATQYHSGRTMPRGMALSVGKDDFDLSELGISCKVIPETPTDKMEQLNMAVILSEKLNMPSSELLQGMGYENIGLSYELWKREFLRNAEVQAQAQAMLAEATSMAEAKVQMAMQQAQMGAQAGGAKTGGPQGGKDESPLGAGGGVANTAFGALGGTQGTNPALGGISPTQGAPSMTREAITGRTRGG